MKWISEVRSISEITPWDKNPRVLKEKPMKDLRASIDKFGLPEPIVINKDGTIIGGHGRYYTLIEKGIKKVACFVAAKQLTEKEFEELNVRLNKNIAGEWDWDALANEFDETDLVDWGFSEEELQVFDDYSEKNKEIDVDEFSDEMIIKLSYTQEEYQVVKDQLSKIADTPEQAVWKLLGNE